MEKEEKTGEINEENVKEIMDTLDKSEPGQGIQKGVYNNFLKQIDYAKVKVKLDKETEEMFSSFNRIIEVDVPFVLDKKFHDKQVVRLLSSFRVQHNNKRGPYFGGVRFYPRLSEDEAKALAALTTIKNILLGYPFGGSAGGVKVNPKLLSKDELARLSHGYIKKLGRFVGPDIDILICDRGVDGRILGWMADEYESLTKNNNTKNAFLGRLTYGKTEPVSLGVSFVIDEVLKRREMEEYPGINNHESIVKPKSKELKIAIQGFGFVAGNLSAILHQKGHKIVAISDENGGVASIKGIDPRDALHWKRTHGTVRGMPKGISITNEQLLKMKVDVLILAAIENQINDTNAMQITAPLIIEVANFAVTPEADKIIHSMGKTVIPDVLSNTGSIIADIIELEQNKGTVKKKNVEEEIKNKICSVFNEAYDFAALNMTSLKNAAFIMALSKLVPKKK